ncbi:tRNA preQ1(34) S-adenosylmethionine ribosyltransferase-isomerase QueA [Thermanaerovibrio acidaminovorans]|uniref:tRNA preQ1(34) S-adenosylmethionine ribosyltransferase-isomerase QueA n=1 Tax=Thermanaerovibrio acidaminovorans TaxID=81462 RepID=UPI0024933940|nr:tRNA preQ1(34) S-adenosylmethionine ribosyltransferase-isomerase QueA [Thermanaerovibrio acidaminovorans]
MVDLDLDLVDSYDYHLPEESIAQSPVEPRDSSRLMVIRRSDGSVCHRIFRDLVDFLRPGDLLVMNDTRVMRARLLGRKESGGSVEVFLLSPLDESRSAWTGMVRPGRKVRPGTVVRFSEDPGHLAVIQERLPDGLRLVHFPGESGWEIARTLGEVPLPPYIENRQVDGERYQTVYSDPSKELSVASPTAGLHFTRELLSELESRGVGRTFVTLNIGLGTFRPVKAQRASDHVMHLETCLVSADSARMIREVKARGNRVVAVGTTVVRTLESYAINPLEGEPFETDLFIRPGFRFRVVDAMITNFHLPRSTLLMLVAAFGGYDTVMGAYREAVARGYRFFSFGDAMLLI